MKPLTTTFALVASLTTICFGQDPARLPGPKNPSELERFILDGMKEAKVPGLGRSGGEEGQGNLDRCLRLG